MPSPTTNVSLKNSCSYQSLLLKLRTAFTAFSISPTTAHRISLTTLVLVVIFFTSRLGAGTLVTNVFRNGVNGYSSEIAVSITTQDAVDTAGNGFTYRDAAGNSQFDNSEQLIIGQSDSYEARVLVRFDNLNLPPGAEIQSATLDLAFNFNSQNVSGRYLRAPWNPAAAGDQGLGWLHRDNGLNWDIAGAAGLGTDLIANKSFVIADFLGAEHELKTITLDTNVVQGWANDATANQGIWLINTNTNPDTTLRIWSGAANVAAADKPQLTIVYKPGIPPAILQNAAANPNPVTGMTNEVSVLGADDGGEAGLSYTWSATGKPPGATSPAFSPNGVNAAKHAIATYAKAGQYTLQAIVRNHVGLTATSAVNVTVSPVLSAITVSPASAKVLTNATQLFTASARDQFGDPLAAQPSFAWSINGGGSISQSGLFTAGSIPGGPFLVKAESGGQTGTVSVIVRLPNRLPSTSLLTPTNGQTFIGQPITGWTNILLTATASDADGVVTNVEFYAENNKLGEDASTLYSLTWTNAPSGMHQLTVRAVDDEGGASTSSVITVTVARPDSLVTPFFAPAQSSGALVVKLYPTEGITGNQLVTFGVPFPRGSIGSNDLEKIRVLRSGQEIPAHVDALTPWRHARNATLDGTSLRVVRIQIHHPVGTTWPNFEPITVEWGMNNRTLNVTALENPRTGWHLVTTGTFAATNNVFEPNVLAVLPKGTLCLGLLKPVPMTPLDDSIPTTREDPAAMSAIAHWPAYLELDHAVHNFFFSLVNQDDPLVTPENQCPYRTDFEPWLYDRASAMFVLYFRSGQVQPLREAIRATQFYYSQLYPDTTIPPVAVGAFKLKVPQPTDYIGGNGAMYSYNECLAYDYWLCGETNLLPAVDWVTRAHDANDEPLRWSPNASEWTERHNSFHLLANLIAYEVLGGASDKSNFLAATADLIWHQNGAGAILPTNRVDGGLYHYGSQHGDGDPTNLVASSWMTVLALDAMLRGFAVTEDPEIAGFIRRLGGFWKATCKTDDQHGYDTYENILLFPDYMMTYDGTSDPFDGRDLSMVEHAIDVSSGLAWAGYFSALLNVPDPSFGQTAVNLYFTYDIGVNYWTRPAGPAAAGRTAYRVDPWRKYGWEHRLSGSFPWAMRELGLDVPRPRLEMARRGGATRLTYSGCPGDWRIESSATFSNWATFAALTNIIYPTNFNVPAVGARQFFRATSP